MAKMGRKLGGKNDGPMTLDVIASRLGVSPRTVFKDYKRAIAKLKATPGAFEILLQCMRATTMARQDPLRAKSMECNSEFRLLWTDEADR